MIWILIPVAVLLLPMFVLGTISFFSPAAKNLGLRDGRLSNCPRTPNCVCTQPGDTAHHMPPIPFEGSPEQAIEQLKDVIADVPRMKIVAETDDYIHAEATSLLFRFVDDVEFHVDRSAKMIHFRSASRAGISDFGANRTRMQQFRKAFERSP